MKVNVCFKALRSSPFAFLCLFLIASISLQPAIVHAQSGQYSLPTRHIRDVVSNGKARLIGLLSPSEQLQLGIMLPLRNQAALDELLAQLYDPSSPNYHHFLSVAQFTNQFGPTAEDYQAVVNWARSKGFTVGPQPANRLLVPITASVAQINSAFHVSMKVYHDPVHNRMFYSPDREPSIGATNISLWHIAGLDNYSIPQPASKRGSGEPTAATGSGPSSSFLGSDMRAAYYGGTSLTGSGQSVGLLEMRGTDLDDLNTYYSNVGQTYSVPIDLYSTDGTSTSCLYSQGCVDDEQTLDMTQVLGMAPGISRLVLYIGSTPSTILNSMASGYDGQLDNLLSSSWVWNPSSPGQNDTIFEEFQAQGQSFFQAAGDWGAWTTGLAETGFVYPADDPYVTSVGGTSLQTGTAGGGWSSETAWGDTGGGISPSPDSFSIPPWQTNAAANCSSCSTTYRNGPDVAASADYDFYVCYNQGSCSTMYGGTSFAAPMWAAYTALVNQQAVADSKGVTGFLNYYIYPIGGGSSYDSDFHDITSGSNGTYSATTGYDLVTGWGSPNGQNLIDGIVGSQTATPHIVSINVSTNGGSPSGTNYVFTFNISDSTPNSVIYYSITACGEPPVDESASPGQYIYTCTGHSSNASADIYALAPGLVKSKTITADF